MTRTAAIVLASLLVAGCDAGRPRGGGGGGGGDGGAGGMDMGGPGPKSFKTEIVIANGAPQDAPTKFGGPADPLSIPTLVYPPDGVLVPPNLNELEVQFTRSQSTALFEISFTSPYLDLKVYTTCVAVGSGCGYLPDEPTWKLLAEQGRGDTVEIKIRATGMNGGGVGTSAVQKLSFADEDLTGGLYYWAAASGAVNRYDFGRRGQKAEAFYTPQMSGAMCVGCHALSKDGSRVAVGLNIPGPATLRVLDVATRTMLFESAGGPGSSGGSNFEALAPDGKQVITSEGGNLVVRDSATGQMVGTGPAMMNGTMPDWSPDGAKVVFARQGGSTPCPFGLCNANPGVTSANLVMATFSGGTLSGEVMLAQGGGNNYYPSFAPDSSLVAFNRAAGESYDAPDARVMVVRTSAGATPVDLAAVNASVGNSWPKFAPFISHFKGKTIFWLTFSSRRDYALRLVNAGKAKENQIAQLWMVAVSPEATEIANDPGFPPFWLPFQDIATGNHIAQWTEKVARQPCVGIDNSVCQGGEECVNGECVPIEIK